MVTSGPCSCRSNQSRFLNSSKSSPGLNPSVWAFGELVYVVGPARCVVSGVPLLDFDWGRTTRTISCAPARLDLIRTLGCSSVITNAGSSGLAISILVPRPVWKSILACCLDCCCFHFVEGRTQSVSIIRQAKLEDWPVVWVVLVWVVLDWLTAWLGIQPNRRTLEISHSDRNVVFRQHIGKTVL